MQCVQCVLEAKGIHQPSAGRRAIAWVAPCLEIHADTSRTLSGNLLRFGLEFTTDEDALA